MQQLDTVGAAAPLVRSRPRQAFRRVWSLLIGITCLGLSHCGFQLHSAAHLPDSLRSLAIQSSDPYGPLARAVDAQLRRHGFTVVDPSEHPTLQLHLLSDREERALRSVFADGTGAQYQLIYRVTAKLLWTPLAPSGTPVTPRPNVPEIRQQFPVAVAVSHTFFDNPQTALAKNVEQETVQRQLCQQAADQLALQLLLLLSERAGQDPSSKQSAPAVTEDAPPEP